MPLREQDIYHQCSSPGCYNIYGGPRDVPNPGEEVTGISPEGKAYRPPPEHPDNNISHGGYCPDCYPREMERFRQQLAERAARKASGDTSA